jgi:hypothetical protein
MCHRRPDSQRAMASQSTPPRWATRASVKRRRGFGRRHSNGDAPRRRFAVGAYPEPGTCAGLANEGDAIAGIEREMSDRTIAFRSGRFQFVSMQSWLHPPELGRGHRPPTWARSSRVVPSPPSLLGQVKLPPPPRPTRSAAAHSRHRGVGGESECPNGRPRCYRLIVEMTLAERPRLPRGDFVVRPPGGRAATTMTW